MLRRLLGEWDTRDAQVEDEAVIALAFVQIMFHGTVSGDVAGAALVALDRRSRAAEAIVAPEHVAELRAATEKMRTSLQRFVQG